MQSERGIDVRNSNERTSGRRPPGASGTRAALLGRAVLLAPLCACASSRGGEETGEPLPFLVAVVPVSKTITSDAFLIDLAIEPAEELELVIDDAEMTARLVEAVSRSGRAGRGRFMVFTSLPAPMDAEGWNPEDYEAYWVQSAQVVDADLLLSCDLEHAEAVATEKNGQFLLNLPLFLLGGPLTYFVADRSYYVDASLTCQLYDLAAFRGAESIESTAFLARVTTAFKQTTMNFIDRTEFTDTGEVLASLLVPAGFLASETDAVNESLRTTVVDGLASGLATELRRKHEDILLARRLGGFWPVEDSLVIQIDRETGLAQLSGRVAFDERFEPLSSGLAYFTPIVKRVRLVEASMAQGEGEAVPGVVEGGPVSTTEPSSTSLASFEREGFDPEDFVRVPDVEGASDGLRYYDFATEVAIDEHTFAVGLEMEVSGSGRQRSFTWVVEPELVQLVQTIGRQDG